VKLLLDEHYSRRIAEELRAAGHDVESVQERHDLRGLDDRALLAQAAADGRALMTENVGDFMPLIREAAAAGDRHMGVIFTSPRSLPRSTGTIGVYVERIDELLRDRPAEDALAEQVYWL